MQRWNSKPRTVLEPYSQEGKDQETRRTKEKPHERPFVKPRIHIDADNEEASPERLTPKTQGRTQDLRLESLKAFLSKGVNRSSSFYQTHNEAMDNISYQWNKEAETSFQRWKWCMEILPTVMPPTRG